MKLTVDFSNHRSWVHADGHRVGEIALGVCGWVFRPQSYGQWSMPPGQLAEAVKFGHDHATLLNITARLTK